MFKLKNGPCIGHHIPYQREKTLISCQYGILNLKSTLKMTGFFKICIPLILSIFFLFGCKSEESIDISKYYYSTEQLTDGHVFEYRSLDGDTTLTFYYYLKHEKRDDSDFLIGHYIDYNMLLQHKFEEKRINNGWILTSFDLLHYDSLFRPTAAHAKIYHDNIFPFYPDDTSSIVPYSIKWRNPHDTLISTNLIRYRKYQGLVSHSVGNGVINCAKFNVQERVELEQDGHIDFLSNGIELYAEGVGLFYYKKKIGDHLTHEYQLYKIHKKDEFEREFDTTIK